MTQVASERKRGVRAMRVLVIIPAYNEEKNIAHVLSNMQKTKHQYDILVVDDGSTDSTYDICASRSDVEVVRLPANLGIGGARQTGFKYAHNNGYDAVIQIDGDGQHKPEYIEEMLAKLQEGNNLCIGSRFIDFQGFQSSFMRRAGIKILYTLIKFITGHSITDPTSGFRACDKEAIKLFATEYPQDYPEPESIVTASKNDLAICEMPVTMQERASGKSSISSLASVYFMAKVSLAILISLRPSRRAFVQKSSVSA